jgi:hypothetical protein
MASRRMPTGAFAIMLGFVALAAVAACTTYVLVPGGGYVPRSSLSIPSDSKESPLGAPVAGWLRPRLAKGCGSNCLVNVWIGAYSGAQRADSANPPARPMKIAHIINTGTHETIMYDLKPFTQAEYDLVFQRDAAGQPELELVEIPRITGTLSINKKGKIKNCHHAPATFADADFWDCAPPRPIIPVVAEASLFPFGILARATRSFVGELTKTSHSLMYPPEDPIWFSCTSGCCTASNLL